MKNERDATIQMLKNQEDIQCALINVLMNSNGFYSNKQMYNTVLSMRKNIQRTEEILDEIDE